MSLCVCMNFLISLQKLLSSNSRINDFCGIRANNEYYLWSHHRDRLCVRTNFSVSSTETFLYISKIFISFYLSFFLSFIYITFSAFSFFWFFASHIPIWLAKNLTTYLKANIIPFEKLTKGNTLRNPSRNTIMMLDVDKQNCIFKNVEAQCRLYQTGSRIMNAVHDSNKQHTQLIMTNSGRGGGGKLYG